MPIFTGYYRYFFSQRVIQMFGRSFIHLATLVFCILFRFTHLSNLPAHNRGVFKQQEREGHHKSSMIRTNQLYFRVSSARGWGTYHQNE